MTMMPSPQGMMAPAMPSPEQIEQAKIIAEACTWEEVSAILRSDQRRNYSIDIETDATSYEDDQEEKQLRIEYSRAMTEIMMAWLPVMQGNPSATPFVKELIAFANGAFKVGRVMEESIEDTFDQIKNMPPQPNPEAEKVKADMALKEKDLQMRMAEKQADVQMQGQKHQQDMAFKTQEHQLKIRGQQADLAFRREEMEMKREENAFQRQEAERKFYFDTENARDERAMKREDMAFQREEAQLNRQAANEDRQFDRSVRVHEANGKDSDRAAKQSDMTARLQLDQDEQRARRAMEAEQVKGEGGLSTKQEIEAGVAEQIGQVAEALANLQQNQMQIVEILSSVKTAVDEQGDALTKVVGHMTAPRKVSRDPKTGRATGVEVGKSEGDLKAMLERLTSGGRQLTRDKQGRVEAIG